MIGDILPFPQYSSCGGRLVIIISTVWLFFFLLGLYKIIKFHRRLASPVLPMSETQGYHHRQDSFHLEKKGLDSDVVCSLPMVMFKEEEGGGGGGGSGSGSGSVCSICLTEFGDGEWQRVLPNCHHAFHVQCIDAWFRSHSDCPLCRKKVVCGSSSISMETLPREDFCRRPLDYHMLGSGTV